MQYRWLFSGKPDVHLGQLLIPKYSGHVNVGCATGHLLGERAKYAPASDTNTQAEVSLSSKGKERPEDSHDTMGKRTATVTAAPHIMDYYNDHDAISQRRMTADKPNTADPSRHVEEQRGTTGTMDVNAELEAVPLYRAFKPFLWSLRLCGLGFVRTYSFPQQKETHCLSSRPVRTLPIRISASWVYSFVMMVLMVLNAIRLCWAFVGFISLNNELLLVILSVTWMFQCAINAITMYQGCLKYSCLPKLFLKWQDLHKHDFDMEKYISCTKNCLAVTLTFCWLIIAIQMGFTLYNIVDTRMYDLSMTPFVRGSKIFPYIQAIGAVTLFYFYAAWILPIGFFFVICLVLRWDYKQSRREFYRLSVTHEDRIREDSIENSRLMHQKVCQLVETTDNIFTLLVGNTFATNIIIITIIIYNIISWTNLHENPQFLAVHFFWLLTAGVSFGLTATGGALVNHTVSCWMTVTDLIQLYSVA